MSCCCITDNMIIEIFRRFAAGMEPESMNGIKTRDQNTGSKYGIQKRNQ